MRYINLSQMFGRAPHVSLLCRCTADSDVSVMGAHDKKTATPTPSASSTTAAAAAPVAVEHAAPLPPSARQTFRRLVGRQITKAKRQDAADAVDARASTDDGPTDDGPTDARQQTVHSPPAAASAGAAAAGPAAGAIAVAGEAAAAAAPAKKASFRRVVTRNFITRKDSHGAIAVAGEAAAAAAPAKKASFRRVVTRNFITRKDSHSTPPATLEKPESSLQKVHSSLKQAAASSVGERQQTAAATTEQGLVVTAANAVLPKGSALDIQFDQERRFKFEQLVDWNAVVVVYRRAGAFSRRLLQVAGIGPFAHCELYLPSDRETFTILRGGTMKSCSEAGKAYEAFPGSYAWHMWILTDLEYQRIIDWNLDQADSDCRYSARDLGYRLLPSPLHASWAPDVSGEEARNPRKLFNTQAVILAMRHAFGARDSKAKSSQFLLSLNSRLTTPSELAQRTAAFFQVPANAEPVPLTKKDATAMSRHSVTYRPFLKRYPHTDRRLIVPRDLRDSGAAVSSPGQLK